MTEPVRKPRKPRAPRKKAAAKDYRALIVGLFAQTVADQIAHNYWRYVAVRPQKIVNVTYHAGVKVEADCSDGGRDICFTAGLPDDPAGNGYQDYGNSSSIWAHLTHETDWANAEPGDPVTFGYSTGEKHVTWLWAKNGNGPTDWDTWNHGAPGQPIRSTLAREAAGHAGMTVTLCKLNVPPAPPPTEAEILKAETGFYSWTAWRLGEGPWRGYGPANKAVRPAVSKIISPVWWVREKRFLANRKKPTG